MRRCYGLALLMLATASFLSAGCASMRNSAHPEEKVEQEDASEQKQKEQQMHVSLIRDMLAREQYYAALAHIQDEEHGGNDSDEIHLLEAEARRHLGQQEQARALYQALIPGKLAGQAYHGLGLMNAQNGQVALGVSQLRQAAQLAPTDIEIRNDLGYALMQTGDYNAAYPELSTAAELAPDQLRSRKNLIILMFLMGNENAAQQIAQRSGLDASAVTHLRAQAQQIQADRKSRQADTHG